MKLITNLSLIVIVITGCNSAPRPIPYLNNGQKWDKSIVILGDWDGDIETPNTYLHWAPVNAGFDATGEVASKDDHRLGRLYQWGSGSNDANKVAKERYYNETKPKFWNTSISLEAHYTGDKWNNGRGPCPEGWRLPTSLELECLTRGKNGGNGWTTTGKYAGLDSYIGTEFFGLKEDTTPGTGVFFPAAGAISAVFGNAHSLNKEGLYWSAEAEAIDHGPVGDYARALSPALQISEEEYGIIPARHSYGLSVRCVHDVTLKKDSSN